MRRMRVSKGVVPQLSEKITAQFLKDVKDSSLNTELIKKCIKLGKQITRER